MKSEHPHRAEDFDYDVADLGYDPATCDVFKEQNAIDLWQQGRDAWNAAVEKYPIADVDFKDVDFAALPTTAKHTIDFTDFKFPDGIVYFSTASFGDGDVSFTGATFGDGEVSFDGASFGDGHVSFTGATFGDGDVSFTNASFGDGEVSFRMATFGDGNVSFDFASLGDGDVAFSATSFGAGRVSFDEASFGDGDVYFKRISPSGTRFYFAPKTSPTGSFEVTIHTYLTQYTCDLIVENTHFQKPVMVGQRAPTDRVVYTNLSLKGSTFDEVLNLDCTVGQIPDLRRTKFNTHLDLSHLHVPDIPPAPMRDGLPKGLSLNLMGVDRSVLGVLFWALLLHTIISPAHGLGGVVLVCGGLWALSEGRRHWRAMFFQAPDHPTDTHEDDGTQDGTYRSDLYRRLKDIAEAEKDHDRAITFHRLELQHKRWRVITADDGTQHFERHPITYVIDYLFDSIADYGHSFQRPLWVLLRLTGLLFVIYSALFAQLPGAYTPQHSGGASLTTPHKAGLSQALLQGAYTTAANTLPFNPMARELRAQPDNLAAAPAARQWITVLGYVHNVLAFILLFLIGLGLRNRFRM